MAPTHRSPDLVVVLGLALGLGLGSCSCLPSDSPPPARPAPSDPDAALAHDWKIVGHVLGRRALISDLDAAEFHDRSVAVSAAAYTSPWSGRCHDVNRVKYPRTLAEIATTHGLDRDATARLDLGEPIFEYQLQCTARRTPTLTLYVAGAHAVTCWSGVCYLLAR